MRTTRLSSALTSRLALLATGLVMTACPAPQEIMEPPVVETEPVVVLAPDAHWIQGDTSDLLVSAEPGTLRFSSVDAVLSDVAVGDVLVSSIETNAPQGYMRRVLAVETDGDALVLTTEPASLVETFEELRIAHTHAFVRADILQRRAFELFDFSVEAPPLFPGFSMETTGALGVETTVELIVDGYDLQYANIQGDITAQITNLIQLGVTGELEEETELTSWPLAPLPVPGTPIVVVPKLTVDAGIEGNLEAQVGYNAELTFESSNRLTYDELQGWEATAEQTVDAITDFQGVEINAEAKVYLQPGVELSLYGYEGLTAALRSQAYLNLEASVLPEVSCELKAGINLSAEATMELAGIGATFESDDIFDISRSLYTCEEGEVIDYCVDAGEVVDYDGNAYPVVSAGGNCWMARNLETTHLNDGTPLDVQIGDEDYVAWAQATEPRTMQWGSEWQETMGSFYNWYAVETELLCPEGWRMPSHVDFMALGSAAAGGDGLKSSGCLDDSSGWWAEDFYGCHGTDALGFTGQPAGWVDEGVIGLTFYDAYFWTSTRHSEEHARSMALWHASNTVYHEAYPLNRGMSVRCVLDE